MVVQPEVACEEHDDRALASVLSHDCADNAPSGARGTLRLRGLMLIRAARRNLPAFRLPATHDRRVMPTVGIPVRAIGGGERLGDPADSPEHPTEDDAVERHHRVPVGQAE